jgi:hypothetical protein
MNGNSSRALSLPCTEGKSIGVTYRDIKESQDNWLQEHHEIPLLSPGREGRGNKCTLSPILGFGDLRRQCDTAACCFN